MSTVTTKTRRQAKRPPAAAARAFWESAQQLASAAEKVVDAPRSALVEGGVKFRSRETGPGELAAELGYLSDKIDEIRGRLAATDRRLISQTEREKAEQIMSKMVEEGALVTSAVFVERWSFSRQALSKALKAQRVFYVEISGQRYYPDFFLDSRYERRQLEEVSKALGELPGASKLQFFTTRKASLMEQTPLDALARGQFSRVRTAAQGFAER